MWICACKVRAKAARELGRGRTRKRVGGGRGPGRNVTPCDFLNSFRQRTEHSAFLIGRQSVNLSADVRFPLDTKEDCRLYCCLQHCSLFPDSCHFRSQNYSLTFQDQGHVAKKKTFTDLTIHTSMTSTFQCEHCQCFTFKRCNKIQSN